jgi:hypothetical protein
MRFSLMREKCEVLRKKLKSMLNPGAIKIYWVSFTACRLVTAIGGRLRAWGSRA